MKRMLLVAVLALVVASGCGSALKQAGGAVVGASARYYEVKNLGGKTSLDRFTTVGVERFDTSPMLGAVPSSLAGLVQTAIVKRLAATKMFGRAARGAPTRGGLLIRGKFVDFDPGGSSLRAVGFGVNPFLTAQIQVIDTRSNRVLGVAMVTGIVKSIVRTGPSELADGVGKAVKGLVEQHHTKRAR